MKIFVFRIQLIVVLASASICSGLCVRERERWTVFPLLSSSGGLYWRDTSCTATPGGNCKVGD